MKKLLCLSIIVALSAIAVAAYITYEKTQELEQFSEGVTQLVEDESHIAQPIASADGVRMPFKDSTDASEHSDITLEQGEVVDNSEDGNFELGELEELCCPEEAMPPDVIVHPDHVEKIEPNPLEQLPPFEGLRGALVKKFGDSPDIHNYVELAKTLATKGSLSAEDMLVFLRLNAKYNSNSAKDDSAQARSVLEDLIARGAVETDR